MLEQKLKKHLGPSATSIRWLYFLEFQNKNWGYIWNGIKALVKFKRKNLVPSFEYFKWIQKEYKIIECMSWPIGPSFHTKKGPIFPAFQLSTNATEDRAETSSKTKDATWQKEEDSEARSGRGWRCWATVCQKEKNCTGHQKGAQEQKGQEVKASYSCLFLLHAVVKSHFQMHSILLLKTWGHGAFTWSKKKICCWKVWCLQSACLDRLDPWF